MMKMISVTISVPESDIKLIDVGVEFERGDRDTADAYNVGIWEIEIDGLKYDIDDFDDVALEDKAIQEWEDK